MAKKPADKRQTLVFRPNPVRQAILAVLALVGIGIGYGLGYLFKKESPPPPAADPPAGVRPAAPETTAPNPPIQPLAATSPRPTQTVAEAPRETVRPILPQIDTATPTGKVRAYEEALPAEVTATKVEPPPAAPPAPVPSVSPEPGAAPGPTVPPSAAEPWANSAPPAVEAFRNRPVPLTEVAAAAPLWRRNAVALALDERPRIAIVIDDLGVDKARSRRAVQLPSPLTLSYLTYAADLGEQTEAARAAGHELLMHVPMEPSSLDVDPGPNVLLSGIPEAELLSSLKWNLQQFDGFVGVNNHMGSRFTADAAGMAVVMRELKRRGLMFLDSVTANRSVGRAAARRAGVAFAARHVFLDHLDDKGEIERRLGEVEKLARAQGFAIAIGHPRDATLEALGTWLAGIEERGFQLVPLSAVVRVPEGEG